MASENFLQRFVIFLFVNLQKIECLKNNKPWWKLSVRVYTSADHTFHSQLFFSWERRVLLGADEYKVWDLPDIIFLFFVESIALILLRWLILLNMIIIIMMVIPDDLNTTGTPNK